MNEENLNLSLDELKELMPAAFGLTEEEAGKIDDVEEFLYDIFSKHDNLTGMVHELVSGLMPMIFYWKLSNATTSYKGFCSPRNEGFESICKMEIEDEDE